uniref:Uncharacterized protein n=1 Tax=Noccaea caerulescens TaxID=107243 RepID=A0A1J3JAN8_NOCCA
MIPKASVSPPLSPSPSSSSSLSLNRRQLLYQSAAVLLSLSSIVGPDSITDSIQSASKAKKDVNCVNSTMGGGGFDDVNLAEEAKLTREGAKAPSHVIGKSNSRRRS